MGYINPEIARLTLGTRACLKFTFRGHLTAEDSKRAILEWRQAFQSMAGDSFTLIWDCLLMGGYEHDARSAWTHALVDMKPQIEAVWLITESPIIKMGGKVMGMFTGLNIHIVKSEDEIRRVLTPAPMPFLDTTQSDAQSKHADV